MDARSLRIVFMGTPDFAVASLKKMLEEGYNVVGVITAPDKPAGRGKRMQPSSVKQYVLGLDREIPLIQPDNLKDPSFIGELKDLEPDLQVVVAFRMLPEVVWHVPGMGTFNLHASLLPQYRGAAPVNHAIINGETETGVTTFMIDAQIDTGNILLQRSTPVGREETAGELHDRLKEMGAELVMETIARLAASDLQPRSQDHFLDPGTELKKAPKISREFCRIQWNRPGREISNLIRGLSPRPAAFTYLEKPGGEKVLCKIFKASYAESVQTGSPGLIQSDGKSYLHAAVPGGTIQIESLQQEGRRRMDVKEFLAGTSFFNGPFRFS